MGCDIHLFLEKRRKDVVYSTWYACKMTDTPLKGWSDRDYSMFSMLANVRSYGRDKHIKIKGFPKDASDCVKWSYCYELIPDESYDEEEYEERSENWGTHYCSESKGDEYIREGLSTEICQMGGHRFISYPDYHSPNWCIAEELEDCIESVSRRVYQVSEEWLALLSAMKAIESTGFYECRAVFWFDN